MEKKQYLAMLTYWKKGIYYLPLFSDKNPISLIKKKLSIWEYEAAHNNAH